MEQKQSNLDVDEAVNIEAVFGSALNFTETDAMRSDLETQTTDIVALKMALEDLYDFGVQNFGKGYSLEANLKRTSLYTMTYWWRQA